MGGSGDKNMKDIYIIHQYLDKNHFKALYECGEEFGYRVKDYFVLDKFYLLKNVIKKEIFNKKLGLTYKEGWQYYREQKKLLTLENELVIVGLAPYDPLLKKYQKVFQKNKCVYFSSWQTWDGTDFPRGSLKYKPLWEKILREDFSGSACVSKRTQAGVGQYIKNTIVVNHAVPVEEYHKKLYAVQNNKFLFFGRFEDAKNMDWMLRWLESSDSYECEFDFAGFGAYQSKIGRLAQKDRRVHYLGLLDKSQLKEILCKYDFIIMPSKTEPFGISLIEALASGTPCVTSDALGPAEIITDGYNGIVCNHTNYNSFVSAMNRVKMLSQEEYERLCNNARASGEEYSSRCIAKKWSKLLDSIE